MAKYSPKSKAARAKSRFIEKNPVKPAKLATEKIEKSQISLKTNDVAVKSQNEIEDFQSGVKNKFKYLTSFLSIVLIVIGLYFLLNGLFSLAVKDTATDNTVPTIAENVVVDGTGVIMDNLPDGNISDGSSTGRVEAATLNAREKSDLNISRMNQTGRWNATDYAHGDIGLGDYEVRKGDTLWEISEAVYGTGFEWHKILDANSKSIGYLPNGSQALIVPGQILKIYK